MIRILGLSLTIALLSASAHASQNIHCRSKSEGSSLSLEWVLGGETWLKEAASGQEARLVDKKDYKVSWSGYNIVEILFTSKHRYGKIRFVGDRQGVSSMPVEFEIQIHGEWLKNKDIRCQYIETND